MDNPNGFLLVVEDIPDILNLLEATLKFKGYRVITARNGEEALEVLKQERPSLIITDILMPKMDGFNLVHRLRINPETRTIPVVFLSATYVAPEDKVFAHSIGVNRFIEKPVDLVAFLPIVERILAQGENVPVSPLSEDEFYEGYRKRLETKLKQKATQITREEHLLETLSEDEKSTIKSSLRSAFNEREEIQQLLNQIREQVDARKKPESEE
ncbi:MAG: response regulator [Chloroflexota bacterium]